MKAIKGQDYTPRTKETRVGKEEEMPDLVSTLPCPSSGTQPLEPYTWAALAQARREARPGSVDTLRQAGLEGKLCTGAFTAETVDAARADEREAAAAWLQVLLQRELARADGVLERCRGAHREAHVQHRELEERFARVTAMEDRNRALREGESPARMPAATPMSTAGYSAGDPQSIRVNALGQSSAGASVVLGVAPPSTAHADLISPMREELRQLEAEIRREADRDREFRERQEELLRRMEGAGAAARVPLVPPRPGGLDRDAVLRALDDALRAATDEFEAELGHAVRRMLAETGAA